MTSDAPPVRPLDARRAQLREFGYTDSEISTIILKEVPPPHPQAAAASGMTGATAGVASQGAIFGMTGVLNNLNAALSLVTGFLPSVATDITHLIGRTSTLHERSKGGVYLVAKLAFLVVIGFAIYREFGQHIIDQPNITHTNVSRTESETCSARVKAFIDTATRDELLKGNPDLARDCGSIYGDSRRGAINAAELAAATTDKTKADACNARVEQMSQNMPVGDVRAWNDGLKLTPVWDRIRAQYEKDCVIPPPNPEEAEGLENAIRTYKGGKQIAITQGGMDDSQASIYTACMVGAKNAVTLQLGENKGTDILNDANRNCFSAAKDYKNTNNWHDVAVSIKRCAASASPRFLGLEDELNSYAGLLACSCVGGAEYSAKKTIPTGDERAIGSLMKSSNTICRVVAPKFAETDGFDAADKYQSFLRSATQPTTTTTPTPPEINTATNPRPRPGKPAAPAPTSILPSVPERVSVTESAPTDATANPEEEPDVAEVRRLAPAAARGDADAQLQLGRMYEAGRGGLPIDPQMAVRLFRQSADQGFAAAQVQLAARYETGKGTPKDLKMAAQYYRLAANQGNASGQSNLADAYEKGAGVPKDLCEAKRLRLLAAAQGEPLARRNLAEMRAVAHCKY